MKVRGYLILAGGVCLSLLQPVVGLAGELVFYSSINAEATDAVTSGFQEKYPDITVNVVRAGSGSLMQRLKAEAGQPQADVVWAGTPGTLKVFADLFQPYETPEAKDYPEGAVSDDKRWLAIDTHLHVFLVNKDMIPGTEIPRSWKDLLNDNFKTKIIMGNPAQSSSAYEVISGVQQNFGNEAFDKLASLVSTVSTSSAVTLGVSRGEFPIAITLEYLAQDYIINGATNLEVVYPSDGAFVSFQTVAIAKGAPHLGDAKKLIDYIASKEARERILEKAFRRPTRQDVDVAGHSPLLPLASLKTLAIDEEASGKDYGALQARWKEKSAANQ